MSTDNPLPSHQLLSVTVTAIDEIARDTKRLQLETSNGQALPAAEAGAHIGVHLPSEVIRQYSLLTPDSNPNTYEIGVKLDPHSTGGSRYIIESLKVGDTLLVEAPRNNFPLTETASHTALFAGGIGITPIWSMVQRLNELGLSWELHYASRSRADAAFLDELEAFDNAHLHFDDEAGGVLNIGSIVSKLGSDCHVYCCGPTPMLQAFETASAQKPPSQIHVEYFTNAESNATEGGFVVELARSKLEVVVTEGKTILEAIREAGVDAPSSCEEGVCGSCEMRVLSGTPDHRDIILSDSEREANDTMMICCSGSKSDRLVIDY